MISRRLGESGGGVLSFTFLDVLTCTMGSLILLVVILGEKAKDTRLEDALRNPRKSASTTSDATDSPTAGAGPDSPSLAAGLDFDKTADAIAQLSELRKQGDDLEKLRAEAKRRLAEEQARISHLEEHERRLEHELAKLHASLELLNAAEQKQTVDQETAERELKRLTQLVTDTETQIQSLRTMAGGKKSYAVVPYKGKYGTFRRPIYIECSRSAITIQPEGIRLLAEDFGPDSTVRAGNPLAAAVRAVREELNARAAAAGEADMPNAYPLFIIRPDGTHAYFRARAAIESWDSDYGEEYVDAEWKLEYPDADPRLEQLMRHAIEQAIDKQAMLARIAPREYRSNPSDANTKVKDIADFHPGLASGNGDRPSADHGENWLTSPRSGNAPAADDSRSRRYGELAGSGGPGAGVGDFADEFAPRQEDPRPVETVDSNAATSPGDASGQDAAGVPGGPAPSGSTTPPGSTAMNASAPPDAASAVGGTGGAFPSAVVGPGSSAGGASVQANTTSKPQSSAKSRGANWANAAAERGAPITRPIHVVVNSDQLAVSPTSEAGQPTGVHSVVVTFHQPREQLLDQLAAALQRHIADWGFAGKGMYWRPTLVLEVAPDALCQAERLTELLADSGVDVRLEHVAALPEVEPSHATR